MRDKIINIKPDFNRVKDPVNNSGNYNYKLFAVLTNSSHPPSLCTPWPTPKRNKDVLLEGSRK